MVLTDYKCYFSICISLLVEVSIVDKYKLFAKVLQAWDGNTWSFVILYLIFLDWIILVIWFSMIFITYLIGLLDDFSELEGG